MQEKPETEWVRYQVPAIVSEDVWRAANDALRERGRGRGKQGKAIEVLLRSRIMCPRCGLAMLVRRDGKYHRVYYHCTNRYRPLADERCSYSRFIPASWDEIVWNDVCILLRGETWIDQQLAAGATQEQNVQKLIDLERKKITRAEAKIEKVREGFDGGFYDLETARSRVTAREASIDAALEETRRLQEKLGLRGRPDVDVLREDLRRLRDRNLDRAGFEERLEVIAKLGIKVHPSEDLKSMRAVCNLDLGSGPMRSTNGRNGDITDDSAAEHRAGTDDGKVMIAPPRGIIGRTSTPLPA